MKPQLIVKNLLLIGAMTLGLALPALAAADEEDMPHPMKQGDVVYMMDGVDQDSREAMRATAKDYSLRILNANKIRELAAPDSFIIKDSKGATVLSLQDCDPLIYVKLPAGTYTIDAMNKGVRKTVKTTIEAGKPVDLYYAW